MCGLKGGGWFVGVWGGGGEEQSWQHLGEVPESLTGSLQVLQDSRLCRGEVKVSLLVDDTL